MVEPRLVEHHLHTCLNGLHDVRRRCPLDELRIVVQREHQTDIDTRQGSRLHGEEHRLRRHEIRSLDIDIPLGVHQNIHISLLYRRPRVGRVARHNLREAVGRLGDVRRIIPAVGDKCLVDKVPVDEERPLEGIHCRTLDFHVRVTPVDVLLPLAVALDITQGDVHSTDESHLAVDDDNLAVVAVVSLARENRELHRHERMDFDAFLTHPLVEAVLHLPARHIVIDEPYLDTLASLGDERVGDEPSESIVVEDEHIDMYVVLCLGDG